MFENSSSLHIFPFSNVGCILGAAFCFFYPKRIKSRQNPTSWVSPQLYAQLDTKSRLNQVTQVTFQQEKSKTEDLSKMRKPRVPISLFSYLYNQTILPSKIHHLAPTLPTDPRSLPTATPSCADWGKWHAAISKTRSKNSNWISSVMRVKGGKCTNKAALWAWPRTRHISNE